MMGGRKRRRASRKPSSRQEKGSQPDAVPREPENQGAEATPIERYSRYLIEQSFDLILLVDRGGEILYASPSTDRMLGYKPQEAVGTRIFDYIHPDDRERALDFYYSSLDRNRFSNTISFRVRHNDGSWRILEAIGHNLLDDPAVKGIVINARDITDRTRLEDDLKRSEEYFRSLTESTSDVIIVLDTEGKIRYISPSVERTSGYRPEEVIGRSIFDFAHPDDIEGSVQDLAFAVRSPGVTRYAEIRIRHKDGTWHHYEAAANNLLDSPVINGILIHTRDITERKQWEEALRDSEERYRLIYDFTGEAIYTYDTNLVLIGVNKKACELIGYSEEEILGKIIMELDILHPDDFERTARDIQRLFNGEVVNDELRFIQRDGTTYIGDVTGAPLYNREGEIIAFTNVAHDITARKLAEQRLDRLNRCLLGLGPDPLENIKNIVLTGMEILGGRGLIYARLDKGRLTLFSPLSTGEEFSSPDDPEDYACYDLIASGAESLTVIEDLEEAGYAHDPFATVYDLHSFFAFPTRLRGKTVGALCLLCKEHAELPREDMNYLGMIAQALAIEEERLAHEESIRHFVDIASHELRTPLSIIKGYADAFQCGDLQELNHYQLDKIKIINDKADKMAKTINDLLDLSRIERGHFVIEKKEVELGPLVRSAVNQMQEKGAGNVFEVSLEEGLASKEVDAEMLVDALLILLDNAVNYSPLDSEIHVEVKPRDEMVVFSVMDRGAGIPEKDRESIFERFYQLEDSRHHSASGLGLGLFIAQEIVRGHGGSIWYEPRAGGGSVFSFSIP